MEIKTTSSPINFLKEVRAELNKVKWPAKQDVVKMTGIVIGVSVVVGVLLSGFDLAFTKIFELVLK